MGWSILTVMSLVKVLQQLPPDSFEIVSGGFSEDDEWTTLKVRLKRTAAEKVETALTAQGINVRADLSRTSPVDHTDPGNQL